MASKLEFIAQSSPAFDQVPPFQWSKSDFAGTVKHMGQPDLWKFEPVHHKWSGEPLTDSPVFNFETGQPAVFPARL